MIRVHSVLCKTSQGWLTSNNDKAYWPVLLTKIKLYILRSLLMVDMEFVIPFKAPSIPISICLGRRLMLGQKGGGRGASLWSLGVLCYVDFFFMSLFSNDALQFSVDLF